MSDYVPLQELYGNPAAGRLLSMMSRLFTSFLQSNGFTCGFDDLLLVPAAEAARSAALGRAEALAINAGESQIVVVDGSGYILHVHELPSCLARYLHWIVPVESWERLGLHAPCYGIHRAFAVAF